MPALCRPLLFAAACAVALPAAAAEPIDVARIDEAPAIDGRLVEAAWSSATLVDDFLARMPVEGAAPSRRTEVLLVYTARALYVGLRAHDAAPDAIRATTMRRDDFAVMENDQFAMAIDSFRDLRSGYWFSTNPLGARVDAQFSDQGERFDDNWNGVWAAAAHITDIGWTAEIEIPWATLRFRAAPEVVMGINLFRRVPETNEQLFAPLVPTTFSSGTPSVSVARPYRFRSISGGARLDLRPFALGTYRSDGDERADGDGGLFARVPLSEAVTLSATWRADFSETEVDDAQLNLSRFPLFLPEKRDFFLENAGSFAFGAPGEAELFFSRTIGFVSAEDGFGTVPIDWGVKAAGRAGRLEFGALSLATGDAPGVPGERIDVGRGRFAVASRSELGAFWSRRDDERVAPHTTAGMDFSHYFARETRLQGFVARDEQGDRASDGWFAALSRGGEALAFELSALELEPGFEPAVGLVARPGTRRARGYLALPWFPETASDVRRYAPSVELRRFEDLDGPGFEERASLGFDVDWRSDLQLDATVFHQRERLVAPFALYRDVVVAAGEYDRWQVAIATLTDPTRPVNAEATLAAGDLYGGRHVAASYRVSWRPHARFFVSQSLVADRVELDQADFTAWVAQLRVGLTASARLRVDLVGQYESERRSTGVGVRGRYDFREGTELVVAWDAVELRDPLRAPHEPATARSDRGAVKLTYLVRF